MDYEPIMLEMLARIQVLEEKVGALEAANAALYHAQQDKRVTTGDIRDYIMLRKRNAAGAGQQFIVLRAGDIHRDMRLVSRMPQVCNAMRQCMSAGDKILFETPSGYSSTLKIQYHVGREKI